MKKTDLPELRLDQEPNIHPSAFVAKGVQLMGDVRLRENASIWYNSVLRGDINYIEIGKGTNIQDGTIIHLENDRPCVVGEYVTVGHRALLHGCVVEDAALIGMGAILLNGVVVGKGACVAAGSVVKENTIIEPYTLWAGTPATQKRELPESVYNTNVEWAEKYIQLSKHHAKR